jgi:hypothetical protein
MSTVNVQLPSGVQGLTFGETVKQSTVNVQLPSGVQGLKHFEVPTEREVPPLAEREVPPPAARLERAALLSGYQEKRCGRRRERRRG